MMKNELLTGATAGIGPVSAEVLGRNGYRVPINGVDQQQADEASNFLQVGDSAFRRRRS